MLKRLTAVALAALLCVGAVPAAQAADAETMQQTIRALGIMTGDKNGELNLSNAVTRAEFTKMMCAAAGLGDSISTQANVSMFKDVKSTHWAAGYVKVAVDNGWMAGYTDGTFRPENTILLEEAATALLRMLGYDSQSLSGAFPSAQMNKYRALGLDENMTAVQGQALKRSDCVTLFYNLMGAETADGAVFAAAQGLTVNAAGEVDYASLVAADRKGPFIAQSSGWSVSLPFAIDQLTVNGARAEVSQLLAGDVYYYNENLRTVWVYRNRVTGVYTAASPSAAQPTGVTVAGVSYSVSSTSAAYALSDMGEYHPGDVVTLLLGMNGDVVGVAAPDTMDTVRYGVVQAVESHIYDDGYGGSWTGQVATILCTDGQVYQDPVSPSSVRAGSVVEITVRDGETSVKTATRRTLTGTVDRNATAVGSREFADNIEIMDVNSSGEGVILYPDRLSRMELSEENVRYYTTDETGKINRLILDDATGDLDTYGILTSVTEVNANMTLAGQYQYLINGQTGSFSTQNRVLGVEAGPARFEMSDTGIEKVENLKATVLTSVTFTSARNNNQEFGMSDAVQVYILRGASSYTSTNLESVSDTFRYSLRGYYDRDYTDGGCIRIIIATEK